ncbi:MAG TPA: SDR family NAD(P)-dependent oxidoreductase [Bacteroidota bacterium]|nr:SDR family NAD(P)-dependent oxidoreductase [Bacteroidota bacterium]
MEGPLAIVTGGTGALGSVICSAFLNTGVRVAIPLRPGGHAPRLPGGTPPGMVFTAEAAIDTEEGSRAFVRALGERWGDAGILVNGAGAYAGGEAIGELTGETFEEMLSANLRTAFYMSGAVLPAMRRRASGRIVSIAAMAALDPQPKRGAYAIAKRGVVTLTETIALETKGTGITANAIAPGIIVTPANRASMPSADVARWVTPEEIAAIILFLCSADARSVSGTVVKAYGGV